MGTRVSKKSNQLLVLCMGVGAVLLSAVALVDYMQQRYLYCRLFSRAHIAFFEQEQLPNKLRVLLVADAGLKDFGEYRQAIETAAHSFRPFKIHLQVHRLEKMQLPQSLHLAAFAATLEQLRHDEQIVVVLSRRGFWSAARRAAYSRSLDGYADPKRGIVYIDLSRLQEGHLASTIQHELAHLFFVAHDPPHSPFVMAPHSNGSLTWSSSSSAQLSRLRRRPW